MSGTPITPEKPSGISPPNSVDRARTWIAASIFGVAAAFIVGAGVRGLWFGNFQELLEVWAAICPIVGALVFYYFPLRADRK